jgi:hypothetical protein
MGQQAGSRSKSKGELIMKKQLLIMSLATVLFISCVIPSMADDQDDALKAANELLGNIQKMRFEVLWNDQTSEVFKSSTTKDSFLENLTTARQPLGEPADSQFIDMTYAQTDPGTGYKGEIYAFNYLNTYATGKFYERIVVVKEKDGKFKFAGVWGSPVPK